MLKLTVRCYVQIGGVQKISMPTEMTKRFAFITQGDLSSAVSTASGAKAGPAADNLGMLRVAHTEFIVAKERTDRLNSV